MDYWEVVEYGKNKNYKNHNHCYNDVVDIIIDDRCQLEILINNFDKFYPRNQINNQHIIFGDNDGLRSVGNNNDGDDIVIEKTEICMDQHRYDMPGQYPIESKSVHEEMIREKEKDQHRYDMPGKYPIESKSEHEEMIREKEKDTYNYLNNEYSNSSSTIINSRKNQLKPNRFPKFLALDITLGNKNISKYFDMKQEDCDGFVLHKIIYDAFNKNAVYYFETEFRNLVKFILDCSLNCWINQFGIVVILNVDPREMRMVPLTGFIKSIRNICDIHTIDIIVIREVTESNLAYTKRELREARATLLLARRETMKDAFILLMDHLYEYYSRSGKGVIKFYNRDELYYEFTNFYNPIKKISIDGADWPTTEHYFQSSKFENPTIRKKIQYAKSAREAFSIARSYDKEKRANWESVVSEDRKIFKELIMKKALKCKFSQFHYLRFKLLSTCGAEIIEHTSNDRYWGDGGNGEGLNRLGQLLKEVRSEIFQVERDRLINENNGFRCRDQRWLVHGLQYLNNLNFDSDKNNVNYN
ncbi:6236_t:CDS:2 [Entrophospora sp. SA101]|nr:6236_t:CDS:2 [Entrophospora sp. SA101]